MNLQEKILHRLFALIAIIFAINMLDLHLHLYVIFWWFDMPMHFAGGFFLMLLAMFISEKYLKDFLNKKHSTPGSKVLFYTGAVVLVSILWELFELFFKNYIGGLPFNILDTISDVCFDIAGASLCFIYLYYRYPFSFLRQNRV